MNKKLIISLVAILGLLIIWGSILVNKFKTLNTTTAVAAPKKIGIKEAGGLLREPEPSLKPAPVYSPKPERKKEEPVEEIELLPPGQKPGVLVD